MRARTEQTDKKRTGRVIMWWLNRLRRSLTGTAGVLIVLVVIATAALAPRLAPHDPTRPNLAMRFTPPAWSEGGDPEHLLGTDQIGRDILSRVIFGARVSLVVGLGAVLLSAVLGVTLGLLAGYLAGWWETLIMRLVDALLAIPAVLLYMTVLAVFDPSLMLVVIVLSIRGWVTYARVVRGEVLSIKEAEYVEAARAIGQSTQSIIIKHVLPNVVPSIIVLATLQVGTVIVAESALSFLGLGVQPPTVTWGRMLADGRAYVDTAWWIATFPGMAITLAVLGVIFTGDWLRDVLDPRLKT